MAGEKGPTQPYDGYIDEIMDIFNYSTGDSYSFVYFCSVGGRADRTKYEWKYSPLDMNSVFSELTFKIEQYRDGRAVFAISFPPVTKIMGWELKSGESNLQLVDLLDTSSLKRIPKNKRNKSEIGCLLDLKIFAAEAKLWAEAKTPEDYFSLRPPLREDQIEIKLLYPNKLAEEGRNSTKPNP